MAAATLAPARVCVARARRLIRIGHNLPPETPYGIGARAIAAAIAADPQLGDLLRVEVYDNGELGDTLPSIRSCVAGSIEMVIGSSFGLAPFDPLVGVFDAPFLFKNVHTARATLDGAIGDVVAEKLKTKGVNVLAWGENGLSQMTSSKPIRTPADLVGLKLRLPPSDVAVKGFRALGVNTSILPFLLVHETLRTGEIDAQENPVGAIEAARLYEVQKYLCLTKHTYRIGAVIVCQDLLDELTPAQRAALRACAHHGREATRRAADEEERVIVARLRTLGMTVIGDIDSKAFQASAQPFLNSLSETFGQEFMASLIQAATT
jgi:tripartite ATP-independent transporter DctP family solute receptor